MDKEVLPNVAEVGEIGDVVVVDEVGTSCMRRGTLDKLKALLG